MVKNPPASAGATEDTGSASGLEDPLEKEMATHSSILARIIPWTEELGWLQSIGSEEFDMTEHAHTHKLSLQEAERMWVQRETV